MAGEKQCPYCGRMFVPDRRVGARQKACSTACAKLRKRENNEAFRRKNQDYWRGRYEVVKAWRAEHPEYQKNWRRARRGGRKPGEIQAEMFAKALDAVEKNVMVLREIQAEFPVHFFENAGKASFSLGGSS
jgi:hypothetical protein